MTALARCRKKWKSGSYRGEYPKFIKRCVKSEKGGGKRRSVRMRAAAPSGSGRCGSECAKKVANRVKAGDRTPRTTMMRVCQQKCKDRPAGVSASEAAAVSTVPTAAKRDIAKLCTSYCQTPSGGKIDNCAARCKAGDVGPGKLATRLASVKKGSTSPALTVLTKDLKHSVVPSSVQRLANAAQDYRWLKKKDSNERKEAARAKAKERRANQAIKSLVTKVVGRSASERLPLIF